jgi:peptidoglycan/xylan/chitin deacetylase (PgdA/CDA1 family)
MKRAVEVGLCRSGVVRLARRLRRRDVLVLAYHNVVPDGVDVRGDRSLHIGQERLHRQLSLLSRTHELIPIDRIREEGGSRARVAVTFDDAYRGAILLGGEVLADLKVPATVFVAPACLGGRRFWWDILSREQEMEPTDRERALTESMGKTESVLARANSRPDPDPDLDGERTDYMASATETELDAALGIDGLTLGSHSWSHPNLTALDPTELAEELERPLEWLRERYHGRAVHWLSYPYGRWSHEVASEARRVGYRGAFRIEGGWIKGRCDPFELPRANVPAGLSVEGLALRGSGLVGR